MVPQMRAISSAPIDASPITSTSVPIGYADGYRRSLTGRGRMAVAGCPVPVV